MSQILRDWTFAFAAQLGSAIRKDWPLYALTAIFILAGMIYLAGSDHVVMGLLSRNLFQWSVHFAFVGPFVAFIAGVIHVARRMKGRKRLAYKTLVAPRRMARFAAGSLFLMTGGLMFTSMFSSIKTNFPNGSGFVYDRLQADIDKALHFGVDPFHYLYGFAKQTWLLRIIELNYGVVWFIVCYYALYFMMTSPRMEKVRVRFALTWLGSWILVGTVMASHWLSAGPIYYGRVTGDTARFGEQVAFLATTAHEPVSAHVFQQYLWSLHESGQLGLGSGISAFPSMHVALITVVALFASERSRRLGIAAWSYAAIIMFSSVYLGWHYAIDGYAAFLAVLALYWSLRSLVPLLARLRWRRAAAEESLGLATISRRQ